MSYEIRGTVSGGAGNHISRRMFFRAASLKSLLFRFVDSRLIKRANQSNETAFPFPANLTPSLPDSERPTSIEAFKAEFVRRFENDMYAPFLDLAFWGDATDEEKQKYLEGVKHSFSLPSFSHRATVRTSDDVVIPTLSEYGDWAYYPSEGSENVILDPPPTHVMGVTAHFSDDVRVSQHFAVGQRDGTYYFSTIQDTTESANTIDSR